MAAFGPGHPAYNIDWIFSNNSDVHVANHRDWFTTYTPFNTSFNPGTTDTHCKVEGVGDVELTVKTHPTKSGTHYQRTLVLRDVLYAPTATCNILGGPIMDTYNVSFGKLGKLLDRENGSCWGLLDTKKLYRLRLRGQRSTQTSLDVNKSYFIRANWPDRERALWNASKNQQAHFLAKNSSQTSETQAQESRLPGNLHSTGHDGGEPALTQAEKAWLKKHWGNEFKFLRAYGLKIYNDEDRDEGRTILRAMMKEDSEDDEDGSSSENSFLRDLEDDPYSRLADHVFSERQLDWIKEHYGNSHNFLVSHGLKFYDEDDCEMGKAIVQAELKPKKKEVKNNSRYTGPLTVRVGAMRVT